MSQRHRNWVYTSTEHKEEIKPIETCLHVRAEVHQGPRKQVSLMITHTDAIHQFTRWLPIQVSVKELRCVLCFISTQWWYTILWSRAYTVLITLVINKPQIDRLPYLMQSSHYLIFFVIHDGHYVRLIDMVSWCHVMFCALLDQSRGHITRSRPDHTVHQRGRTKRRQSKQQETVQPWDTSADPRRSSAQQEQAHVS